MKRERTFSLSGVVSKGFEASCIAKDGALYFWHRNFGVRIEKRTGKATLLTDPAALPDARWVATSLEAAALEAAALEREPLVARSGALHQRRGRRDRSLSSLRSPGPRIDAGLRAALAG